MQRKDATIGQPTVQLRAPAIFSAIIAVALVFGLLPACAPSASAPDTQVSEGAPTNISLWVYPIGRFSDPDTVQGFVQAFNNQHPDITVNVEYLDYATGDDQVNAAIDAGTVPDVVMEGPERIVSNWGAKGAMADLSDLWTDEAVRDITADGDTVMNACKGSDGSFYEYPLCKTAHCMAINYEVFEKAGALQYLDLQNRTWTTDGFIQACKAVAASGLVDTPGIVYCGGQGGDQGTRALVTNLYGASFTNAEHTAYTIDSPQGIQALATLKSLADSGTISYNTDIQASDELALFAKGSTAMSFAWNSSNEENYASKVGFTPYAMTFPTNQEQPSLCSGIWGFGAFNTGDSARIEAAKTFIRFLCDDSVQGRQSVRATKMFPVRSSFKNAYDGTSDQQRIAQYGDLLKYAGDYYNITPGWAAQRTVWWNMLQQVFSGADPQEAATWYTQVANNAVDNVTQVPVAAISTRQSKNALFISSYSIDDPTVEDQIAGIRETIGDDVNLHVEFMDSRMISDETYVAAFYRYISQKYSSISDLGAIVVGDDNALQMVIRYQNGFFRNIPVVYESANNKTLTELADSLGMTGVPARNTIEDNLNLARKLYPHATKILAISDKSASGVALSVRLQAVKSKYTPMSVEILDTSTCTADEIAKRVEGAGTDTIVLYLSFTTDAEGKTYPHREALNLVSQHAATPVFTLGWLGSGTLGGIAADSQDVGRRAGAMANGFLNESDAAHAGSRENDIPTIASFDYSVMSQFGLDKRSLPADAVYYNDYELNTGVVTGVLAAVSALLIVIVLRFVKELRRRKTEERQLQQLSDTLRTEAEFDVLTGLGNRRVFDREIERSSASGRPFTLIILDLDDFKRVNDTYGHPVGDQVLRETGKRLERLKSRAFVPYRYGGDEFGIMAFSVEPEAIERIEQQLLGLFEEPIRLESGDIGINVSLGSARFPADASSVPDLVRRADRALYAAKLKGKNRAERYGVHSD